jgi:hypothetical protein
MNGSGPLYDTLHRIFDADYPPTTLHHFFARLPKLLKAGGIVCQYPLIVTTNYDDLVEQAFRVADEPLDVVAYIAEGNERGRFRHIRPNGTRRSIDRPNKYADLSLDARAVLLKVHGAVQRGAPDHDSYVITEDDYIEYLSRTDISQQIPAVLRQKLLRSNFLFLGYGLRDWNLRAILHRIWGQRQRTYASWGVQLLPDPIEQKFWSKRDVELFSAPLNDYVTALHARVVAHVATLAARKATGD